MNHNPQRKANADEKDLSASLRKAVSSCDLKALKRLLKGGADINSTTFWYDASLLHEAVSSGSPSLVRILLDAKADVSSCCKDGRTPLHVACRCGQEEIVLMLLDARATINAKTEDGRTPLHVALWRGHEAIAKLLISHGADVRAADRDGTTALHWAAKTNLLGCTEYLLSAGSKVNATDKHGRTALHEALTASNARIVSLLLTSGADPNVVPKMPNVTSLQLLIRQKECDIAPIVSTILCAGYRPLTVDRRQQPPSVGRHSLTAEANVHEIVDRHQRSVLTLKHICRLAIRQSLIDHCRSLRFLEAIGQLPLPPALCEYVAFRQGITLV